MSTAEMSNQAEAQSNAELVTEIVNNATQPGSRAKALLEQITTLSQTQLEMQRDFQKYLRDLAKEFDRDLKRLTKKGGKRKVTQKPVPVNADMVKFMNSNGVEGGQFTRQSMMKTVSAYIKTKNLQTPENKKAWKADATLRKLFGLKAKDQYTFMNINGMLSGVITPASA